MTSDEDLVRLAANAYGLVIPKKLNAWLTYKDMYGFQWWNEDGTRPTMSFNPLNDGNDALQLAVKLGLHIAQDTDNKMTAVFLNHPGEEITAEPWDPDAFIATRRAIVRAAAKIAKLSIKKEKIK